MSKYKIRDGEDVDQIGLASLINRIENPSSSTTAESLSGFSLKKGGNYVKLIFAGTLAISSMGNIVEGKQVKFSRPKFTADSLKEFNRTIEKPFNDYISELSEFTVLKGHITKKDIIDKIIAFRSLNENWDGYGAFPLEVKSASNAVQFMHFLNDRIAEQLSDIFPTPNGTVSCVWENEVNERVALEFGNNTYSYYVKLNSQKPMFFNEVKVNAKEANKVSDFIKSL